MDSYNIQNYIKRGKTVILTLRQGYEEPGSSITRQWTDIETGELVSLMREYLPEFKNQKRRKKEVWIDVTRKLCVNESSWTAEDCRKKWSNMIRTFKTIEEQRRESGSSAKRVKWQFHDRMMELLSCEGAESLPEAAAVCAFMKEFPVSGTQGSNPESDIMVTDLGVSDTVPEVTDQPEIVEESVEATPMEFYLTENHTSGSTRGNNIVGTPIEFSVPSGGDFHTLATVAAAAATGTPNVQDLMTAALPPVPVIRPKLLKPKIATISNNVNEVSSPPNATATVVPAPVLKTEQINPVIVLPLASQLKYNPPTLLTPANPSQSSVSPTAGSCVATRAIGNRRPGTSDVAPRSSATFFKKKAKLFRKESRKRTHTTDESCDTTGDPLVDKFIAISNKQNEKMLQRMEKYHEDTLSVMRERNKILENMVTFLKSQITSPGTPVTAAHAPVVTSQNLIAAPTTFRVINAQTLSRAGFIPSAALSSIAVKKP